MVAVRRGDSKKEAKKERQREERGEKTEIAELIVKVSTKKPSQDSHCATG